VTLRWNDYVLLRDTAAAREVSELWAELVPQRKRVVYLLGLGFDPRALFGLRALVGSAATKNVTVVAMTPTQPGPPATPERPTTVMARLNAAALDELAQKFLGVVKVPYPAVNERSNVGQVMFRKLLEQKVLDEADLVIIDISSLPGTVHFPILGGLLEMNYRNLSSVDLQVVATENPDIDDAIHEEGTAEATPIGGFKNGLDFESKSKDVRIWAPVVGERQDVVMKAILDRLEPREICPVLPFPARNPRRADDLLLQYRQLLLDDMQVETGNIIYANEANPFDLYRALSRLNKRYVECLAPVAKAQLVVSSHASKTLSLGVFLAAYEHKLPVVAANATTYSVTSDIDFATILEESQLICAWLDGIPYRDG